MNRMKTHDGHLRLNNVVKSNDLFLSAIDVKDFAGLFGVDVQYLDMSKEENKNKQPMNLGITSINVENGEFLYNTELQQLTIFGEIVIIDGVKKFDINAVHPDSTVNLLISTYSKDEVRSLLSQANSINKRNSQ